MLYLRLYWDCLQRAGKGATRSPWTLALPVLYLVIMQVAGMLLGSLDIIGGILYGIVATLCTSSFLYFIQQAVLGSPSRLSELGQSFLAYFWPVMSFGFVVWMATRILGYALAANPQASIIMLGITGIGAVLLNAVFEVIYQKGQVHGIAIIGESVGFIQRHWIEWFIPNLILAVAAFFFVRALAFVPFGTLLVAPVGGVLGYFVATFRGNLFHELETTSPYQLKMRYRKR